MLVFHGSSQRIDYIDIDKCHLGWHCGNICQAIDITDPKRHNDKFDWETTYIYVSDIYPTHDNTIYIEDKFRYSDNFLDDIITELSNKLISEFPNISLNDLYTCESERDVRDFLLYNNIKYIAAYENLIESRGLSFVILDEGEIDNIQEYTFYDFLTINLNAKI